MEIASIGEFVHVDHFIGGGAFDDLADNCRTHKAGAAGY